jgi:hypothetical protein
MVSAIWPPSPRVMHATPAFSQAVRASRSTSLAARVSSCSSAPRPPASVRARSRRFASARHEQDRVLRVLQHRGRDLAEIQRLAGRAADAHHDQIITPEARLSQDGILGRPVPTSRSYDRWSPSQIGSEIAILGQCDNACQKIGGTQPCQRLRALARTKRGSGRKNRFSDRTMKLKKLMKMRRPETP